MNTLQTQQSKYKLTGDSVTQFKSYKGAPTLTERLDRLERTLNPLINGLLIAFVVILAVLLMR